MFRPFSERIRPFYAMIKSETVSWAKQREAQGAEDHKAVSQIPSPRPHPLCSQLSGNCWCFPKIALKLFLTFFVRFFFTFSGKVFQKVPWDFGLLNGGDYSEMSKNVMMAHTWTHIYAGKSGTLSRFWPTKNGWVWCVMARFPDVLL